MIKVWDLGVRLFHWSLVATFAVAWLSSDGVGVIHVWSGYIAVALIALRLVWGLVGPRYARFTQFIKGPTAVIGYLKSTLGGQEPRYIGHNPAGAAMIVALLVTMSATVYTGWLTIDPTRVAMLPSLPAIVGPAFAEDGEGEGGNGSMVGEVHGALANLMMLLVVLHVAGVVFASRRHQENLAAAMVNGMKRTPAMGDVA